MKKKNIEEQVDWLLNGQITKEEAVESFNLVINGGEKSLNLLSKEDAEKALFLAVGGKPSGYEYINHTGESFVFHYTNTKGRREAKRFKIEQFGFKAFNYLQSQGYILK